jgi:hypothetical protein
LNPIEHNLIINFRTTLPAGPLPSDWDRRDDESRENWLHENINQETLDFECGPNYAPSLEELEAIWDEWGPACPSDAIEANAQEITEKLRTAEARQDAILDRATNAMFASIQDDLGVTDGGFCDMWFDGPRKETLEQILIDYMSAEMQREARIQDNTCEIEEGDIVLYTVYPYVNPRHPDGAFLGRVEKHDGRLVIITNPIDAPYFTSQGIADSCEIDHADSIKVIA